MEFLSIYFGAEIECHVNDVAFTVPQRVECDSSSRAGLERVVCGVVDWFSELGVV